MGISWKKSILVVIFLFSLAVFFTGCSGTPDSSLNEGKASTEGSSETFSEKFTDMIMKKNKLEFSVSYDFKMTGAGMPEGYQMTQYFGDSGKMRMDTETQGMSSRVYVMDKTFYSCNQQASSWNCLKLEQAEEMQNPAEQFNEIADRPEDYDITYAGTMKVAGATAYCYGINAMGSKLKQCFSKEGVPLYMKAEAEGSSYEMKASKYSTNVDARVFELPAEPVDMGAMMKNMQAQMPNMG